MRAASPLSTLVRWMGLVSTAVAFASACHPVDQQNARTVAAIEIPLRTDADRHDFVEILRREASTVPDLHVDDVTPRWRQFEAQNGATLPGGKGTIFVGVWRGRNDDESIAQADDMGHPGRVWLTFSRGEDIARSAAFRSRVLADVQRRWPNAVSLPILPSGAIPLTEDLELTPSGYRVLPSAASRYGLAKSSPFVASQ